MKLALVLLMSAVGFGQVSATSKAPECRLATCNSYYPGNECLSNQTPCPKPTKKPHKPKPSVKTSSDLYSLCRKNAGTVAQCKAEAAPPVWCQGCGGGDNYPAISSVGDHDPGPVEMLKPDGCDVAADECWVFKPALAESSITSGIIHTFEMNRFQAEGRGNFICPQGEAVCFLAHVADSPPASQIDSATGSVVKLSDSEYSHLQQLRASVVEEEKRLAVKYGATVPPLCSSWPYAIPGGVCEAMPQGPHYEFHGQLLLIDKGGR